MWKKMYVGVISETLWNAMDFYGLGESYHVAKGVCMKKSGLCKVGDSLSSCF